MANNTDSSSTTRTPSPTDSASSFQLVDNEQTLPKPGEYASLELLHPIIQFLGHDLGSTKRLTFSSLHVVSHSTKLYKEIYGLIKKVNDADSPDWVSYDKYSKAIEPLEDLLFQFAVDADSEKLSSKKLIADLIAADGAVYQFTDCTTIVTGWEADRERVKTLLDKLKTHTDLSVVSALVEAEAKASLKHDDELLMSALAVNIAQQNPSGIQGRALNHIKEIKTKVEAINTLFKAKAGLEDASSVKCVSSLMLVNEALEAYKATSTAISGPNKEWNAHLKKESVWGAAKSLLKTVHGHINDAQGVSLEKLKEDYDAFLNALHNGTFEVPSLLELIRKAARVKRPFYLQSLVLVGIFKTLAEEFSKEVDKSAAKFIPLDEALTAGVNALTQAAQAVDNLQNLNEAAHKQKSDALFGAVNAKLTECLKAYNKQADEATYKDKLTAALSKDKVALERIQTKLNGRTPFTQSKPPAGP